MVLTFSQQSAARGARDFQLGAGVQLAFTAHDLCSRYLDVHECQTGTVGLGPQIFGNYRFAKRAAFGFVASFWRTLNHSIDVSNGSYDGRSRLVIWRTAAEIRLFPVKGRRVDWWIAFELGLTGATDSHVEDALLDARRIHQLGFATGIGTGIDFHVSKRFLLGWELRAIMLLYGDAPRSTDQVIATEIGSALWPVMGLINFSVLI